MSQQCNANWMTHQHWHDHVRHSIGWRVGITRNACYANENRANDASSCTCPGQVHEPLCTAVRRISHRLVLESAGCTVRNSLCLAKGHSKWFLLNSETIHRQRFNTVPVACLSLQSLTVRLTHYYELLNEGREYRGGPTVRLWQSLLFEYSPAFHISYILPFEDRNTLRVSFRHPAR